MPDGEVPTFPCPACGFIVFAEPTGSFDICSICGWEDDHVQLRYPSLAGGANSESLFDAQQRVIQNYPVGIHEERGFIRDPTWRPLNREEASSPSAPATGQSYFEAAAGESPDYYWQDSEAE